MLINDDERSLDIVLVYCIMAYRETITASEMKGAKITQREGTKGGSGTRAQLVEFSGRLIIKNNIRT